MMTCFFACLLTSIIITLGAPDVAVPEKWDEGAPHLNNVKAFGATAGRDFFYSIPTRGSRKDLTYSIIDGALPQGVSLDPQNGIISGRTLQEGAYDIVIGDKLMLTPQLGWCSWNTYYAEINSDKILAEAHAMVDKGLAARGFCSVNIDSGWQGERTGKDNALQANENFPDMKGLTDEIHSLGLRAGIYSTPMVIAFGTSSKRLFRGGTSGRIDHNKRGYYGIGETHYEAQDAAQWAEWGFDYLKYDWDGGTDWTLLKLPPHCARIIIEK